MLAGCGGGPHVRISAPPASAPPQKRLEAYDRLKPLSMHETHVTTLRGGVPVGSFRQTDYLQLADGTRVYQSEDLLQVVPEESPSATAAREADSKDSTADTLQVVAWGLIVVGGVVSLVPLATPPKEGEKMNLTPLYIGVGMIMLSLPFFFWGGAERSAAQDEKATAIEMYEPALRDRLDLCAEGERLGPCQ
jgi:hypothetical protein